MGNDPIRSKNSSKVLFLEAKLQLLSKLLVTSAKKIISMKPPVKDRISQVLLNCVPPNEEINNERALNVPSEIIEYQIKDRGERCYDR